MASPKPTIGNSVPAEASPGIKFVRQILQNCAFSGLSLPHVGHFISSQFLFHPPASEGEIKIYPQQYLIPYGIPGLYISPTQPEPASGGSITYGTRRSGWDDIAFGVGMPHGRDNQWETIMNIPRQIISNAP